MKALRSRSSRLSPFRRFEPVSLNQLTAGRGSFEKALGLRTETIVLELPLSSSTGPPENQRIESQQERGRAPHLSQPGEAQRGLFILQRLSPHTVTALLGFPTPSPPPGAGPKSTPKRRREGGPGRSGRWSHALARGEHHVVPAAEECREGGAHLHPRRRTLRASGPHPPPTPAAATRTERTGPAGRRRSAWRPTVTRPPGHSLPAATRPSSRRKPLTRLAFSAGPNWLSLPHSPRGSSSRRKVPGIGGKPLNSMTRWVSSFPRPPCN